MKLFKYFLLLAIAILYMNHSKAQAIGIYSGGIAVVTISPTTLYTILDTAIVDSLYTFNGVDSTVIDDSLLGNAFDHPAYWIIYLDATDNSDAAQVKIKMRLPIDFKNNSNEYEPVAIDWSAIWVCVPKYCRAGCEPKWSGCSECSPMEGFDQTADCKAYLTEPVVKWFKWGMGIFVAWFIH